MPTHMHITCACACAHRAPRMHRACTMQVDYDDVCGELLLPYVSEDVEDARDFEVCARLYMLSPGHITSACLHIARFQ